MPDVLGDQPEPTVEPPERFPGGTDALTDEEKYGEIPDQPVIPDLTAALNPKINDKTADELDEHEEGQQDPRPNGESHPEKDPPD
jgi:hypothetical protein